MTKMPIPMHTTVSKIYAAYEEANKEENRPHLGASLIGHHCDRSLFYTFRWADKKQFDGRLLRLFETGHLAEPRMAANLRAIGVDLHEVAPDGSQWRVSDIGGHFGGSLDGAGIGFPEGPKTWAVWENKTSNTKGFKELQAKGLEQAKPLHYDQCTTYMGYTGMERALYTCSCKETDEIYSEWVHFDPVRFARIKARAERIITATEPPDRISNDPSWYQCKFCDFSHICHGEALPRVNCRTCAHSTPELNGDARWSCAHHLTDIPLDAQRTGCSSHRYIPIMLQRVGHQVDVRGADVVYKTEAGLEFVNGEAGLSSQEIYDLDHKPSIGEVAAQKRELAAAGISCTVVQTQGKNS